jgi:hypothetical protein
MPSEVAPVRNNENFLVEDRRNVELGDREISTR